MQNINDFNDVVEWVGVYNLWSGDLLELEDEFKDQLCYQWLRLNPEWLDDIFPHTVSRDFGIVLDLTYRVGIFADCDGDELATLFKLYAIVGDDQSYWSEALEDFRPYLDKKGFVEGVKEQIYLYLETRLREEVQEAFDCNLLSASAGANLH